MIDSPDTPPARDSSSDAGGASLHLHRERMTVERETTTTYAEVSVEIEAAVVARHIREIREIERIATTTFTEPLESAETRIESRSISVFLSRERALVSKKTVIDSFVDVRTVRVRDDVAVAGDLRHEVVSVERSDA